MNDFFFKSIADMISSKKVVIYGAGYLGAVMLNVMDELGKEVLFFLDQNPDKQKNKFWGYEVKPPEDIIYEDMSEMIVVIAVGVKREIEELLTGFGLKKDIDFVHGAIMRYEACDALDPFLGYSRSNGINGFMVMNKYDERYENVICLGGSTTDYSMFGIKSWPQYLAELFEKNNIHLNVLNGGVTGYTSSQELLKLIRDGLALNPTLVISYSGVNDMGYPPMLGNKYLYGVWTEMENAIIGKEFELLRSSEHMTVSFGTTPQVDSAEYWYQNEMMMFNVCHGFGIPFLGILQPSTYTRNPDRRSIYEQRVFNEFANGELILEQFKKAKNIVNESEGENILDFTALFDESENVYVDHYHVFEHGNQIIAEAIYRTIKEKRLLNI